MFKLGRLGIGIVGFIAADLIDLCLRSIRDKLTKLEMVSINVRGSGSLRSYNLYILNIFNLRKINILVS